jgi:hypothetical protein
LSASTLRPYLSYYYERKADKGVDDIPKILAEHFGEDGKSIYIRKPFFTDLFLLF